MKQKTFVISCTESERQLLTDRLSDDVDIVDGSDSFEVVTDNDIEEANVVDVCLSMNLTFTETKRDVSKLKFSQQKNQSRTVQPSITADPLVTKIDQARNEFLRNNLQHPKDVKK